MDTPDFRTHKEGWMLLAGFEAGLQSDSVLRSHAGLSAVIASEAKQSRAATEDLIASSLTLLAMTGSEKNRAKGE
ncbi:hypothetical protein [Afipia sp. GAS231]|uniref:hypothetical protein n=1 Tax=Afipia sp. GAS231 TaxID=1882747 RepID=UPI000B840D4E|nr:hypothetical protein [Afipia sp. GAS231]